MTALEYIHAMLDVDFPKESEELKDSIRKQMRELGAEETPSTDWNQEELLNQFQLVAVVYPYLTLVKAMVRRGTEKALAISYANRLWSEMPEEIKDMVDDEHRNTMEALFRSGSQ